MKQVYRVIVPVCQFVAGHRREWIAGLARLPQQLRHRHLFQRRHELFGGTFFKAQIADLNGSGMIVDSMGTGARDVVVTNVSPWPDHVLRPGFRLQPLSEVNTYIQKHHHLPDIPSEAEVKEEGVSVGEMQVKLLAKVEELTLHMIQQERENKKLRERLAQLETRASPVMR